MAHFRSSHHSLRHLLSHCRSSTSDRITNPLLFNAHGVRFRKLEVILTTSIDKLGKAGETVKVAPGYFRNHLMPKLLAFPNIDKFAFLILEQRQVELAALLHDIGMIIWHMTYTWVHTPNQTAEFRWKDYCPMVFRHLRKLFAVDLADYMMAICGNDALRELSSPGKRGSFFYLTQDDRFMIKTLKKSEVKLYQREEEEEIVMDQTSETADDIDTLKEIKMKEYQTAAVRLNKALLVLRRHIKIDNELREPVENDDIVAEVARQLNINIHPDNLHLPSPISSLGQYTVPLRLPREIPCPVGTLQWKLDVKIRRK